MLARIEPNEHELVERLAIVARKALQLAAIAQRGADVGALAQLAQVFGAVEGNSLQRADGRIALGRRADGPGERLALQVPEHRDGDHEREQQPGHERETQGEARADGERAHRAQRREHGARGHAGFNRARSAA